jgi:hypothetical protein
MWSTTTGRYSTDELTREQALEALLLESLYSAFTNYFLNSLMQVRRGEPMHPNIDDEWNADRRVANARQISRMMRAHKPVAKAIVAAVKAHPAWQRVPALFDIGFPHEQEAMDARLVRELYYSLYYHETYNLLAVNRAHRSPLPRWRDREPPSEIPATLGNMFARVTALECIPEKIDIEYALADVALDIVRKHYTLA